MEEVQLEAYEQQRGQLFPGHPRDALDPSDPAFFIDDAAERLDVSGLGGRYAGMGERAHPPQRLLQLWLCGTTDEAHGERELARWNRASRSPASVGIPFQV